MPRIVYCVTATLADESVAEEYLRWLLGGHADAVLAGGAEMCEIVRLDGEPPRVESRYHFASRDALAAYEAGPAVALRADGARRFGDLAGVSFERRIGETQETALTG